MSSTQSYSAVPGGGGKSTPPSSAELWDMNESMDYMRACLLFLAVTTIFLLGVVIYLWLHVPQFTAGDPLYSASLRIDIQRFYDDDDADAVSVVSLREIVAVYGCLNYSCHPSCEVQLVPSVPPTESIGVNETWTPLKLNVEVVNTAPQVFELLDGGSVVELSYPGGYYISTTTRFTTPSATEANATICTSVMLTDVSLLNAFERISEICFPLRFYEDEEYSTVYTQSASGFVLVAEPPAFLTLDTRITSYDNFTASVIGSRMNIMKI